MYIGYLGNSEDDLALEVIVLCGTVCNDDACAKMMAEAGLIQILIDLLNGSDSLLSQAQKLAGDGLNKCELTCFSEARR